jgi:hypothetical protein
VYNAHGLRGEKGGTGLQKVRKRAIPVGKALVSSGQLAPCYKNLGSDGLNLKGVYKEFNLIPAFKLPVRFEIEKPVDLLSSRATYPIKQLVLSAKVSS